ncbi:MAG: DUF4102 domain-containing protein [Rhodoferax sp.]|nr:DUF4102 domain-containing protein [Rhodoferax sp.]
MPLLALASNTLFTRALGGWPAVSIDMAKAEAHRLRGLTEQGIDPREGERQQEAAIAAAAQVEADKVHAVTVGDIWPRYLAEGKPKRKTPVAWSLVGVSFFGGLNLGMMQPLFNHRHQRHSKATSGALGVGQALQVKQCVGQSFGAFGLRVASQ